MLYICIYTMITVLPVHTKRLIFVGYRFDGLPITLCALNTAPFGLWVNTWFSVNTDDRTHYPVRISLN